MIKSEIAAGEVCAAVAAAVVGYSAMMPTLRVLVWRRNDRTEIREAIVTIHVFARIISIFPRSLN